MSQFSKKKKKKNEKKKKCKCVYLAKSLLVNVGMEIVALFYRRQNAKIHVISMATVK